MAESKDMALTENGALSFPTTLDSCVDLFFKTVRGISEENLVPLLDAAWAESPEATLRIIFQTRDCRGGKGEKKIFYQALRWLHSKSPAVVSKNLTHIPFFGTWKDLLAVCSTIPEIEGEVIDLFVERLKDDKRILEVSESNKDEEVVSLCAKWAPTEKHSYDAKQKLAKKIAAKLCGSKNAMKEYRTGYLVPLRNRLRITERFMCANEWDNIPYSTVPSRCMNRNKFAFVKHDEDRFQKYLLAAMSGKAKLQGKQMYPHELVSQLMRASKRDLVVECQWKSIMDGIKEMGSLNKSIVLSDVSGSMSGVPMQVSIALGLLISEVSCGPFRDMIITFESCPKFHHVQGENLLERVRNVMRMSWGGSTNFQAALDLILTLAKKENVPQDDMPDKLFVISDMQFNQADGNYATNHQVLEKKFKDAGYEVPLIVYWNVRPNTTEFPALSDTPGVALLAGYSPSLLKVVMDGCDLDAEPEETLEVVDENDPAAVEVTKVKKEINPADILKKAISDERYNILEL
uniref:TROVE domain-containing protein n=1 Tax=Vannella robusta TaxID=1487602 RepID=A0A7S4HV64_9EUKA